MPDAASTSWLTVPLGLTHVTAAEAGTPSCAAREALAATAVWRRSDSSEDSASGPWAGWGRGRCGRAGGEEDGLRMPQQQQQGRAQAGGVRGGTVREQRHAPHTGAVRILLKCSVCTQHVERKHVRVAGWWG